MTGGLIGSLVGLGIPESNAQAYEEALRNGGVVLGEAPHNSEDSKHIQEDFEKLHAENICYC